VVLELAMHRGRRAGRRDSAAVSGARSEGWVSTHIMHVCQGQRGEWRGLHGSLSYREAGEVRDTTRARA
jgi:hypothetical protein